MKRTLLFGLLLFLFSPLAASAQVSAEVAKGYCPDRDKDFFKGSIYHENGKRKITGDIPLTPVYDLVVRIKPELNYYCIPGWGANKEVTVKQLPPSVPIRAGLIIGKKSQWLFGTKEFLSTGEKDEQGRFLYEWKIKGWKNGITSGTKLWDLINAISRQEPVGVQIELPRSPFYVGVPVSFDLCVPIWGSGPHKTIGMYASDINAITLSESVPHFDGVREYGFQSIQPMASEKYKGYFSFFVDLKFVSWRNFDPDFAILLQQTKSSGAKTSYTREVHNAALLSMFGNSSCGDSGVRLLSVEKYYNNGIAVVNNPAGLKGAVVGGLQPPNVYVHEWGHTFANLDDAYIYESRFTAKEQAEFPLSSTNCAVSPPFDYRYEDKLYGGLDYKGCSYMTIAPTSKFKKTRQLFRPSFASLMGEPKGVARLNEFDVVSCGWVIAAIKGGDAKSYFPECAKMDGIIKDGVTAQGLFEPMLAVLRNLQAGSAAAVGLGFGKLQAF